MFVKEKNRQLYYIAIFQTGDNVLEAYEPARQRAVQVMACSVGIV